MNDKIYDCIVIGGGPAGMMAAKTAASLHKETLLIEKNGILGRKLRITGKGRCNVTNDCDENTFLKNIPQNGKFLYGAINRFTTADSKSYFEELGVSLKTERGQRVFPVSDKAADVAEAMEKACKAGGVVFAGDNIKEILTNNGEVCGVLGKNRKYDCKSVIIATGGLSYPLTGSNGDGYSLAEALGHSIVTPRPSLVALCSNDEACADMQGLSLKNVTASIYDRQAKSEKKPIFEELGEMLFTHFGFSGPLILSGSAHIREAVIPKDRFYLKLDLKPGLDYEKLDLRILRDFQKNLNKDFFNSLDELLPRKMIPIIVKRSGIPPLTKVNSVTREQRKELCEAIKGLIFPIDGFRSIDEAIITSGGVKISEINPKTMESKLVNGLYFAGEIIDVDGYTGGFNLQIAFSTGFVAGESC